MESEFRGIVQQSRDDAESHRSIMSQSETEAKELLENIRTVSAESGVSQHAIHFKTESDLHGKRAGHWKIATFVFIGVLAVYSGLALFKYDWFVPNSGDIQHRNSTYCRQDSLICCSQFWSFFVGTKFSVSYTQRDC